MAKFGAEAARGWWFARRADGGTVDLGAAVAGASSVPGEREEESGEQQWCARGVRLPLK